MIEALMRVYLIMNASLVMKTHHRHHLRQGMTKWRSIRKVFFYSFILISLLFLYTNQKLVIYLGKEDLKNTAVFHFTAS